MNRDPDTRGIDRTTWNEVGAVKRNIESRLSYRKLYKAILKDGRERDMRSLIEDFIAEEYEILARLAGALRQLGQSVPTEGGDPRLMSQFWARRTPLDQLAFLRQGASGAAEWYEERAGSEKHSADVRTLFADLGAMQRRRVEQLDALIEQLGG